MYDRISQQSSVATLFFNNNYLNVLVPDNVEQALLDADSSQFIMRCICMFWPVTNLRQEWGVDDFPGMNAKWAATFLWVPAAIGPSDTNEPDLEDGYFWTELYPSTPGSEPVALPCRADKDRLFFAVASDEEPTVALLARLESTKSEFWIPVTLDDFHTFVNPQHGGQTGTLAHVVVRGEKIAAWTKATINLAKL